MTNCIVFSEIADLLATDPELLGPSADINRESSPTSVLDNDNPMHRTSSFNSRISNPRVSQQTN